MTWGQKYHWAYEVNPRALRDRGGSAAWSQTRHDFPGWPDLGRFWLPWKVPRPRSIRCANGCPAKPGHMGTLSPYLPGPGGSRRFVPSIRSFPPFQSDRPALSPPASGHRGQGTEWHLKVRPRTGRAAGPTLGESPKSRVPLLGGLPHSNMRHLDSEWTTRSTL